MLNRGTSPKSGRGLAICDGASVVAIVTGGGYPIGTGNCPRSDAMANLFVAAPDLLAAARAVLSEIDRGQDFAGWTAAKDKLRRAAEAAERVTFNTSNGWDGPPSTKGN